MNELPAESLESECIHLKDALQHLEEGSVIQAELACFLSIEAVGLSSSSLQLLGRIASRTERYEVAVRRLQQAAHLAPGDSILKSDLSTARTYVDQTLQASARPGMGATGRLTGNSSPQDSKLQLDGHEFSQVWVISLERQPERLRQFYEGLPEDWPFKRPEHFPGIDGSIIQKPEWWTVGAAGWGCIQSHYTILKDAIERNLDSILVLEDDAIFGDNFNHRVREFLNAIPDGRWEWIYLGGQHIQRRSGLPERVNRMVYRPFNVHRAHAYAIRGQKTMQLILDHLNNRSAWKTGHQIDHRFGELHKDFAGRIFVPHRWLVGQRENFSNIKKKIVPTNFFPDAESIAAPAHTKHRPDSWPMMSTAISQFDNGNLMKAELTCFLVMEETGVFASLLHLLGRIAGRTGRHDVAAERLQKAIAQSPEEPIIHAQLVAALTAAGQKHNAVNAGRRAVQHFPAHAECQNNLGQALMHVGRPKFAREALETAVALAPLASGFWRNLAECLRELDFLQESVAAFRKAVDLSPESVELRRDLADALATDGHHDEALTIYSQLAAHNPIPEIWNSIGELHNELGRSEDAHCCFRKALQLDPKFVPAKVNLAMHHASSLQAADVDSMQSVLGGGKLNQHQEASLRFAMTKIHDRAGSFGEAAQEILKANALRADWNRTQSRSYNERRHELNVGNICDCFTEEFFAQRSGWGSESRRPIFVIGLPRSGTTLTERILAAHPDVFGAGELHLARAGLRNATENGTAFQRLFNLGPDEVRNFAMDHLASLDRLDHSASRIVDKMPGNYEHLGWIKLLFPNAKIIRCVRDPRDVALSCMMANFTHLRWTNSAKHLIHRFELYGQLVQHWSTNFSEGIFEVCYEELVTTPETIVSNLLDWLELPWSETCLNHTAQGGIIRTASVSQARRPIYSSSVGRWRNYDTELKHIFDRIVAVEPRYR